MDHTLYDKRKYPIVDVREGYAEWVRTYERTVQDEMDLRLLGRLRSVDWTAARAVLDLACGTGRTAAWLSQRTQAAIDGVDITPEMMDVARGRGLHRALHLADVANTGLADRAYDLCVQSLADEHMADLSPLYRETARVTRAGGQFVLVGFHPYFLIAGIPTHFDRATGESVTIRSYVHLSSHHVKAAHAAGWTLHEMEEGLIDEDWTRKNPKWQKHFGMPVSFAMVWQRV